MNLTKVMQMIMTIVLISLLLVTISSLSFAIITGLEYIKVNEKCSNYDRIIKEYRSRLENTQIQKITLYNYIRQKRNYAFIRRIEFEDAEFKSITQKKKYANHVCAFASKQEEKVLRDIEDFMQKENII